MLLADKLFVERDLEVRLLELRHHEIALFVSCCSTLLNPATLLAGFAYTGVAISEFVPRGTHWLPEVMYYTFTVACMVVEIFAIVRGTMISLYGPAAALRGKASESVHHVVVEMESLFLGMWTAFIWGAVFFLLSTIMRLFVQVGLTLFLVLGSGIVVSMSVMWYDFVRVSRMFAMRLDDMESGAYSEEDAHTILVSPISAGAMAKANPKLKATSHWTRAEHKLSLSRLLRSELVDVVVTVRHGERMRWRVSGQCTVTQLRQQAEGYFRTPIVKLLSIQGAEIERPDAERVRWHLHQLDDEGQSLAFFQAVVDRAFSPTTYLQTLWDDYMHGG